LIHRQHKPRIFLFEFVIALLLFMVVLSFYLLFIGKTHQLQEDANLLKNSVLVCSDVANLYEAGDGSMENVLSVYSDSIHINQQTLIHLNKDFKSCKRENGCYYLLLELTSADPDKMSIQFFTKDGTVVYELTACCQNAATPKSLQEVE